MFYKTCFCGMDENIQTTIQRIYGNQWRILSLNEFFYCPLVETGIYYTIFYYRYILACQKVNDRYPLKICYTDEVSPERLHLIITDDPFPDYSPIPQTTNKKLE